MKYSKNIFSMTLILILFSACLEDFDFEQGSGDYGVVIEGVVSNVSDLTYVKVTKSTDNYDELSTLNSDFIGYTHTIPEPISDALVIITDDFGKVDTLMTQDSVISYYQYIFDHEDKVIDSTAVWSPIGKRDAGIYTAENLVGQEGRKYYLYVKHNEIEYRSEGFMHPVPSVDSISISNIIVKEQDGTSGYVPSIYFNEPKNEKNYYYFDLTAFDDSSWDISIIDDRILETQINGFNIDDGEHPDWWRVNYPFGGESGIMRIEMASISKEVYQYYKSLITQFNNDGGAYSPSPASPVSNISNGALGVFRVSASNIVEVEY